MLDWNYYKPGVSLSELYNGILSGLEKESSYMSPESKNAMKEILIDGRGNGRLARLNRDNDAEGMAYHFQIGLTEVVNEMPKKFGLTKTQKELLYDITIMTFKIGERNHSQEEMPKSYNQIIKFLS